MYGGVRGRRVQALLLLDPIIFTAMGMMVLISTLFAPLLLEKTLKIRKKGTKETKEIEEVVAVSYNLPSHEHSEILVKYIIQYFRKEEFFVNKKELDTSIYQIRKENVFIKFFYHPVQIIFKTTKNDVVYVHTIVNEAFFKLFDIIESLKKIKPREMERQIVANMKCKRKSDVIKLFKPENIIMDLKSDNKNTIINEMVNHLLKDKSPKIRKKILEEIHNREKIMSTGMQKGFAIPHGRSDSFEKVQMLLGIKREGVDFDSLDEEPAKVILLFVSPIDDANFHNDVLAHSAMFFHKKGAMKEILEAKNKKEVLKFFEYT